MGFRIKSRELKEEGLYCKVVIVGEVPVSFSCLFHFYFPKLALAVSLRRLAVRLRFLRSMSQCLSLRASHFYSFLPTDSLVRHTWGFHAH